MAFGTAQLKTFKWLEKVSTKTPAGLKRGFNPFEGKVLIRFGQFYATNGYIMAEINWPEYEHVGDDEWQVLTHYQDDKGMLLQRAEFEPLGKDMRNDKFKQFFYQVEDQHNPSKVNNSNPFHPGLLAECMIPFKANKISPIMYQCNEWLMFAGHDKNVSMRVLMIGEKLQ